MDSALKKGTLNPRINDSPVFSGRSETGKCYGAGPVKLQGLSLVNHYLNGEQLPSCGRRKQGNGIAVSKRCVKPGKEMDIPSVL